jgi:hypothetical protein
MFYKNNDSLEGAQKIFQKFQFFCVTLYFGKLELFPPERFFLPATVRASVGQSRMERCRPQPEEEYAFVFQSSVFCSGN